MLAIQYDTPSVALTQILEWIEERIDANHLSSVVERHVKTLRWEPVDRVPVTFSAPVPGPFVAYPYGEAFSDPTKMLVNELVGPYAPVGPSPSIINSVLVKDDFPLQIRAFYGVGLMASLFGAESIVEGDRFPWARPIGLGDLKQQVARGIPGLDSSLFQRVLDTMGYYKEVLAPYPRCSQAIHITQPDLQGPFDIAAQLWGGEIFTAFYDSPEFLRELLDLLSETYVLACQKVASESTETVQDDFIYLHFTICRGRCLIKDDSSVMLSPKTYADFVRSVNEKVLREVGGGGIHWCGSGDHWRSEFLDTRGLLCLDWGNPEMLDLPAWASALRKRRIPAVHMAWDAEGFFATEPTRLFPTGAAFAVAVDSIEDAKRWLGG